MVRLDKFETYVSFNWAENNLIAINFLHYLNKIYNNLRKQDYSVGKNFYFFY